MYTHNTLIWLYLKTNLLFQKIFYKKAAAFVLRAVAKHSPSLAQHVVDCGALDALVTCLEELNPGVKEAVTWALGSIARHTEGFAVIAWNNYSYKTVLIWLMCYHHRPFAKFSVCSIYWDWYINAFKHWFYFHKHCCRTVIESGQYQGELQCQWQFH